MGQGSLDLGAIDEPIGAVEARCLDRGCRFVLGLDEAGRGPLAGPVTIGGVIVDTNKLDWCVGLDDSKKLSESDRESWVERVESAAIATTVLHMDVAEIDELNILHASLEGMRRVAVKLARDTDVVELALVDGNKRVPRLEQEQLTLVKGDSRSFAIAAASVLAKVARDRWMAEADQRFPGYGFARHKGYPTPQHRKALMELGPCEIHRRSFRPVRDAEDLHSERKQ
jgi:ribonuclease HII